MRDNLPNMLRAAAKEWRKEYKVVATGATRYDAALDEAADAIEELSKPKWIPVTERLPKEADGMVFVLMPDVFPYNSKQPFVNCNQDRRIDMAHYSEHSKTWYFGDCGAVGGQEPIAWIHRSVLPEPPKEW